MSILSAKSIVPATTSMPVNLQMFKCHLIRNIRPLMKCMPVQNYYSSFNNNQINNTTRSSISCSFLSVCSRQTFHSSSVCFKKKPGKSKKNKYDDEDDDLEGIEDDEEEMGDSNSSKIMHLKVTSLRMDLVLKQAFQIARNKIEKLFYESKIRINGYKVLKKGHNVALGDEIDIIKGFSPSNPQFLIVQRVKILAASDPSADDEGSLTLKIRRYKSLLIGNYEEDVYKESGASET
uniref:Uncharacterized protein C6orf203 homolog n=1 Tax=Cacopsylla melanoneura TaxID=428564 RepID=A0A8D8RYG0_9HEMI